jgi:hypothetical protein
MDVAECTSLTQHFPAGTEENHEKPDSRELVSGSKFESGTFKI